MWQFDIYKTDYCLEIEYNSVYSVSCTSISVSLTDVKLETAHEYFTGNSVNTCT